MFSEETLEKILVDEEVRKVPIGTQTTMIKAIERVLEEENQKDDAIYKS